MKRKTHKILTLILAMLSLFALLAPTAAFADNAGNEELRDLIVYYKDHGAAAETDIQRTLESLYEIDPEKAQIWQDIMERWQILNNTDAYSTEVPTGLPTDDSLAIIILGYALNDDGSMKEELIGRLQTGLAFANAYPNAYVVVTGGGTAADAPEVTEGGAMGKWLLENGLAEDRLIVEDTAANTILNAENTYNILRECYPQVNSISIVTSDYHLPRANVLFYTKLRLYASEAGQGELALLPGCGFAAGHEGYESITLQANNVASIAGVSIKGRSSQLSTLIGMTVKKDKNGDLYVRALYENGYERQIDDLVKLKATKSGTTITYVENGVTVSGILASNQKNAAYYSQPYLKKLRMETTKDRLTLLGMCAQSTLEKASVTAQSVGNHIKNTTVITLVSTLAGCAVLGYAALKTIEWRNRFVAQVKESGN